MPAGQEGLLEVISPRVGPDWIRTTDLAVIDRDGFLQRLDAWFFELDDRAADSAPGPYDSAATQQAIRVVEENLPRRIAS